MPQNIDGGILRCLKRELDIGTKAMLSDVKTVFRWNPALTPPDHVRQQKSYTL